MQIYLVLLHYHRGIHTVGAIDIHTVLCLMMQCAAAQNCSILAELHLRCHDVARYEFSHLDENQALIVSNRDHYYRTTCTCLLKETEAYNNKLLCTVMKTYCSTCTVYT